MTIKNLRKEARRVILIDGTTHFDFFKTCSDKYDLNQEKIAKEISKIPNEEKVKKNKFVRTLFLIICVSFMWLAMLGFGIAMNKSDVNEISKDFYPYFAIGFYIIASLPAVFAFLAFYSHKTTYYYICGVITSIYVLTGIINQNIIGIALFMIPAILAFYIPSQLKHKYEKKHITSTIDGNETVSTEYLFED